MVSGQFVFKQLNIQLFIIISPKQHIHNKLFLKEYSQHIYQYMYVGYNQFNVQ